MVASCLGSVLAFPTTTTTTGFAWTTSYYQPSMRPSTSVTHLAASKNAGSNGSSTDFFKAGLLANVEDEAAALASKTIRSLGDLGWNGPAKRRGTTRPRHWAFGGAGEKAIQDKPNYDPTNPLCVEPWLSRTDLYSIVGDDTAVADTIFVALAKGGAYIERHVAEDVLAQWWPTTSGSSSPSSKGGGIFGRTTKTTAATFDRGAFLKTVQQGRYDFVTGWAAFVTITGIAVSGIVFPTNPLQLALVDLLEMFTHTDERMAALAASKTSSSL